MKKHFVTYGDSSFDLAKKRIIKEASSIGWFDVCRAYDQNDISDELNASDLMKIPRGGGLWSWKPDIILQELNSMNDGDILIYADSGCSLQPCKEWEWIEKTLMKYDLIAQRIYQPTVKWTRKEIIDFFDENKDGWLDAPQHCATVIIIKISEFTKKFIVEWWDLIIKNPLFIMDVDETNKKMQHSGFFENRHDQSIYNALVYKYIDSGKILSIWERIEDYDPINLQAIRATRLRRSLKEKFRTKIKGCFKRFIKHYIIQSKWNNFILNS